MNRYQLSAVFLLCLVESGYSTNIYLRDFTTVTQPSQYRAVSSLNRSDSKHDEMSIITTKEESSTTTLEDITFTEIITNPGESTSTVSTSTLEIKRLCSHSDKSTCAGDFCSSTSVEGQLYDTCSIPHVGRCH